MDAQADLGRIILSTQAQELSAQVQSDAGGVYIQAHCE